MAVRTVSELANWDGHLDQQPQNSKWRSSSSSNLARDSYHTLVTPQPSAMFSDEKCADSSSSLHPINPERDSLPSSSANTRLAGRVDTTSTPSHDLHHHRPSISASPPPFQPLNSSSRFIQHAHDAAPRPASPSSPFINISISSQPIPSSSVHPSRVHNSQPASSPPQIPSTQPASSMQSEVIDLTMEDTDDDLFVSKMLAPHTTQPADPGPSRRPLSPAFSSPLLLEHSLFTPPPPPKKRTRLFMDCLKVPPFPDGLTKADYQPLSLNFVVPLPSPIVSNTPKPSHLVESSVTEQRTPSPHQGKGKEREHNVVSPRIKYTQPVPAHGEDVNSVNLLDALYVTTEIPLHEDDTYPPLTSLDLAANSRFQFAHAWRAHASKLREAELDWTFKFGIFGKASIWARSVIDPSPRVSGTTGYVSIEQLRPWELAPPEKNAVPVSDEQAHAAGSHAVVDVDVDANHSLLLGDSLPVSNVPADSALSSSTVSQASSSTVVDTEHDMNQYFNGLCESPNKHVSSRQQLAPTHTFLPHLLHPIGTNSPVSEFSSLDFDPRLADTDGHECFLGVPPSPTTAEVESSLPPRPTTNPPFEPVSYFAPSQSNLFATDVASADTWMLEQGEGLILDDNSPTSSDTPLTAPPPTAPGTINPSLLGLEQAQPPSLEHKRTTPKRRSKLPEPVVYIRRPIDPSTLPLVSGKRSVQIKYRDAGGSPATPSTHTGSNEVSSNPVANPIGLSTSDAEEHPPSKRRLIPSRKLRENRPPSDSDSDFIPKTAKPKIDLKLKRLSMGSIAPSQGTEAETVPIMTCCHQCRNSSVRPKMLCSNTSDGRVCGKRFCNRCILYRYPDITFDEHSAGFLCPACTNTCNCSYCSRSRGEEFVSMRLGGLATSLFKSRVTLVRDVSDPLPRTKSPDVAARRDANETGSSTQSQFWAHVYGLEGEHVGKGFMTREYMERMNAPSSSSFALPKALSQSKKVQKPTGREKKQEKSKRPRVFIGQPLASWNVRAVRDLELSVDVDLDVGNGKGKARARGGRWYIGNPVALHEPYGRMPGTASPAPLSMPSRCSTPMICSDGSRTPFSDLEVDSNWPQPGVGECCEWAPPPPPSMGMDMSVGCRASDSGLSGVSCVSDSFGTGGVGLNSGSVVDATMEPLVNGDERGSTSTTLSEQDLMRAISAALATLSVEPPC